MAGTVQLNHNLDYFFTLVDSTSLIHSNHTQYAPLQSSCSYTFMQRGPRYEAYAALRESKLRMKQSSSSILQNQEDQDVGFDFNDNQTSSQKKHVKFNSVTQQQQQQQQQQQKRSKGPSSVSVPPEYAIASPIRRENRRSAPPAIVIDQNAKTTTRSKSGTYDGMMGRKLAEKKINGTTTVVGGVGCMARRSYVGLEVLKGLGSHARRAINGESNGMRNINPRRNCNLDSSEFAHSTVF